MADLPLIPFVAEPAIDPDHRFVLDEAALVAVLDEAAVWSDFAGALRELEELAHGPPPAFIGDPSDEYLQAIEEVETCLRQRRAAAG